MKVMNNIDFTEFKSLVSVIRHFSNEQTCIDTLTEARWGDDVICPICGEHHCVKRTDGRFRMMFDKSVGIVRYEDVKMLG